MRIVSLVPSLTESLWELGVGPQVLGVTKFCVRPMQARTAALMVGGTKDPDVVKIQSLRPDLVLADEDENPREVLDRLGAFTKVHVTKISSVQDAARELATIGRLVDREHDAEARAQRILERAGELRSVASMFPPIRVFVPIWHRPLMTIDAATYMGDLLATVGARNLFERSTRKYFATTHEEVRALDPEAVLLPTEPYRFGERHRAEYALNLGLDLDRVQVVDGEAFTWFGTRTQEGLETLARQVRALREAPQVGP